MQLRHQRRQKQRKKKTWKPHASETESPQLLPTSVTSRTQLPLRQRQHRNKVPAKSTRKRREDPTTANKKSKKQERAGSDIRGFISSVALPSCTAPATAKSKNVLKKFGLRSLSKQTWLATATVGRRQINATYDLPETPRYETTRSRSTTQDGPLRKDPDT